MSSGHIAIVLAAVLWSTSGAFSKSIDLPGPVMACFRGLFAAIVILPLLKPKAFPKDWRVLGLIASFAIMNIAFVTSMTITSAANTIFLQYSAPIWMILASVFWLKEPVDRRSVAALPIALTGIAIIVLGGKSAELTGILLALLAGLTYAGVAIFLRILRQYDAYWLTFLNMLVSGVILLPLLGYYDRAIFTPSALYALVAFGILQLGIPYVLFSYGLRHVSAQEAAILTLLEPVLNPTFTFFVVGEIPEPLTLAGGALILAAVGARYIPWQALQSRLHLLK